MISRSDSNAVDRLRRTKSTSSTHTSASGYQRNTTNADEHGFRQQAEAAAIEAYERAHNQDQPSHRPPPPKLQRRRSQVNGRSQGSHFEDARRRNLARAEDITIGQSRMTQRHKNSNQDKAQDELVDRVITRRRSVIPPACATEGSSRQYKCPSSASTMAQQTRRRPLGYSDGSPIPRCPISLEEKRAPQQVLLPEIKLVGCHEGEVVISGNPGLPVTNKPYTPALVTHAVHQTQTSQELVISTRDRCSKVLPTKGPRERRSFMLGPFKRRRAATTGNNLDTLLPPYNHSHDETAGLLSLRPMPQVVEPEREQRLRKISGSLKGGLMKVFRKASKPAADIPPQQIQAKKYHFSVCDNEISEDEETCEAESCDPFVCTVLEEPHANQQTKYDTYGTHASSGKVADDRSRVTSWTNSTVAGMSSIRTNDRVPGCTTEQQHSALRPKTNTQVLRKASSFFSRPIQNKLRRPSRPELQGSDESQGLYTALQKYIEPSLVTRIEDDSVPSQTENTVQSHNQSALDTLPSQRQYSAPLASARNRGSSTIRAVMSNESTRDKVHVPSPVCETSSPEANTDVDETVIHHGPSSASSTPQSRLKRRSAVKALPPTQEQLAYRMERFKNRWQAPLLAFTPSAAHNPGAEPEENPYKMSSLGQTKRLEVPAKDLPHDATVCNDIDGVAKGALSPSIYSCATDGASPGPETTGDTPTATITITGREVRRYSISPAKTVKTSQPARSQNSGDWRRWLSGEMSSFKARGIKVDHQHTGPTNKCSPPTGVAEFENSQARDELAPNPTATNTCDRLGNGKHARPRCASNSSSYMNERYPVLLGGHAPSHRSCSRKTSMDPAKSEHDIEVFSGVLRAAEESDHEQGRIEKSPVAELAGAGPTRRTAKRFDSKTSERVTDSIDELYGGTMTELADGTRSGRVAYRPQSAHELRVRYKSGKQDNPKTLGVRRKPLLDNRHLDDSTLRDISAGPYVQQRLGSTNHENRSPRDSPLPALSSSEWLATGAKKKEIRKASSLNPIMMSESRRLPPSPGQRMVTGWLGGRQSEARTPAFV